MTDVRRKHSAKLRCWSLETERPMIVMIMMMMTMIMTLMEEEHALINTNVDLRGQKRDKDGHDDDDDDVAREDSRHEGTKSGSGADAEGNEQVFSPHLVSFCSLSPLHRQGFMVESAYAWR